MIKPIPTEHDGINYRSRTEARWAVFFDLVGIPFRYEDEGYQTAAGWYLPDFAISYQGKDAFFEVKGGDYADEDLYPTFALAVEAQTHVFVAIGPPCREYVLAVTPPNGITEAADLPEDLDWALEKAERHQFPIYDDTAVRSGGWRLSARQAEKGRFGR